jgi:hypothetical protein
MHGEKELVIAEQKKLIKALEQKVTRLQARSDDHDNKLQSIMADMEARNLAVEERFNALSEELNNTRCQCGEDKENVPLMLSSDKSSYVPALHTPSEPIGEVVEPSLVVFEMTNWVWLRFDQLHPLAAC